MTVADLRERLKSVSASGWEWSETNGLVSATQLRHASPLGHLLAYLLASNFLVPMQAPAEELGSNDSIKVDGAVREDTT